MAPLKRSRRVAEPDEEILDVQEASSALRQGDSRKRARVSLESSPKATTPHPNDPESSESDDDDGHEAPDSPPQTQYEIMRDAGFKHLQYIEQDDFQATQKLMRRSKKTDRNTAVESGIIESITCFNFMCHERLRVELGPMINFVVGENGSGKSAVLTALTLCLGGKASDTNRGGSLRAFVKEGCERASLVVEIKNGGQDAYKPEMYGDSIIVERHFSVKGTSGFKLKSATGRLITNSKQEVDEISEWYGLQMGNPLTVLSQDNARQFLNSASPAQKYKYFISGVQLEQLDNDYKLAQDTLDGTMSLRLDLNDRIAEIKKEMEEAQRLAETAQMNQTLREKARHWRSQLVWSQVVDVERALEELNKDLVVRDQKILDAEQARDEFDNALSRIDESLKSAEEAKRVIEEERHTFDSRISEAEEAFNAVKKEQSNLLVEERDAHGRLKTAREAVKSCEKKIESEERRLRESSGSARADKEAELNEAKSQEEDLNSRLAESRQQLPTLQKEVAEAEQAQRRQQQFKELKRKELLTAQSNVQDLEKSTGSPLDAFDREIQDLAKAVASDRGFNQKPVGPIGAHVKLLKPEWSDMIDKAFGEALNAFVVTSKQDQSRLSNMIRQRGIKKPPQIYIAYGGHIDTRSQEPDEQFDTILRVLEIDNELVRSQLIINNQIEKIILVKERREAEEIMMKGDRAPRNVSACLCFHDGKGKRGHGLRITNRNGNVSSTPQAPIGRMPRMQSDSERQVALQRENLKQLGLEMREVNAEEKRAQDEYKACRSAVESQNQTIKTLEVKLRKAQAAVERISEEMDAYEGVDDRLNLLRSTLETNRKEEEQIGSQYGHVKLAKRDIGGKVDEAKRRLDEEKVERDDFQARLNKANEKVQARMSMRRIEQSKTNDAYERVEIEKSERKRAERRRDEKAAEVEDVTGQARDLAPDRVHIPENENYAAIKKKYDRLREQLQQREDRLGASDQEIYERAREARERHENVTRDAREVDETAEALKHSIKTRLDQWRAFQRQISARVRTQFGILLSERGFRGKINLDHKHRKIVIHVEPDETRKGSGGRNTKTLSGGEKSFSSICMLLSVWEAIGSPIRCLDEFDVFMDNVNRAISTNMLVDVARKSVSRQYILITPNAIEGRARLEKDVKIIRLTDPRQRTLI